jgi:hypothetical protein
VESLLYCHKMKNLPAATSTVPSCHPHICYAT